MWGDCMRELEYPFDGKYIIRRKIKLRKQLKSDKSVRIHKRIAILGGSTTNEVMRCLELFLLNYGIEPEFFESEYNQYYQESMFPSDDFKVFHPDLIYICTTNRNITSYPMISYEKQTIERMLDDEYKRFESMWKNLSDTFHCPVIQNNFEMPQYRLLGNSDASDYHGRRYFLSRLNKMFYSYAYKHEDFFICDLEFISADIGLSNWYDLNNWYLYKYPMKLDAIPYLSFNVANIVKSILGKNKKGIVLDLDNTLWGGIVGDDGVENIELGSEEAVGQAYLEFQQYIKEQTQLGVVLAVDSKNNQEIALAGLNHPNGILKPEDMATIKANWESKARNFILIADELSLLPESLVFVDDNPAERHIITQQLEGVSAPDIGSVSDYIRVLDRSGFFESTGISVEDIRRNDMYKENAARARRKARYDNYQDYLLSLDMKASIKSFEPVLMLRISQLTNKSNQFNLTTKRYTLDEIEAVSKNSDYIDLCGKLEDCFGDNGVVSVVIGHQIGKDVIIDLWIMSCRVLKRDMEYAMMDTFISKCKENGADRVIGDYYPTMKNNMVKDFYGQNGFRKISEDENGSSEWEMYISDYVPKNSVIKVNEDN